ncbi:MAG: tetratricopeptide repeat protein [Treponema sp.]|nr:tetratricopeptide repeat protein [Treponema sp.]
MKKIKDIITAASFIIIFVFSACSTAPKKASEVFTNRMIAANQLNLANQTATQGRYNDALLFLEEARRLALSTDDPPLRIKTSLSRGNILFALGRHDEAFDEWESAAEEADASGEAAIAALSRIYTIRGELVLLSINTEGGFKENDNAARVYIPRILREMSLGRSDSLTTAAGCETLSLAFKQMGRWQEAERNAERALAIHEKGRFLEDAAYDWFLIASIRSLSGNYESAMNALWNSIAFDRRAENGFGLANSWQAMGEVHKKFGQPAEAETAFRRAAEIYRAIGLESRAEELE